MARHVLAIRRPTGRNLQPRKRLIGRLLVNTGEKIEQNQRSRHNDADVENIEEFPPHIVDYANQMVAADEEQNPYIRGDIVASADDPAPFKTRTVEENAQNLADFAIKHVLHYGRVWGVSREKALHTLIATAKLAMEK